MTKMRHLILGLSWKPGFRAIEIRAVEPFPFERDHIDDWQSDVNSQTIHDTIKSNRFNETWGKVIFQTGLQSFIPQRLLILIYFKRQALNRSKYKMQNFIKSAHVCHYILVCSHTHTCIICVCNFSSLKSESGFTNMEILIHCNARLRTEFKSS
jgi:hypothetical protein